MAGIENITNEILQEARNRADSVISEAGKKAEEAIAKAEEEIRAQAVESEAKAKKTAADYAARIESQIALRARQAVLAAKQEVIDDVIRSAGQKLDGLDDAGYFSLIEKLIGKNARAAEGKILFSKRDLSRLPEGFASRVGEIAKKAGGTLSVSEEPADIENGFLLRYGGIDENCTFKALFAEKKDRLQDRVREVLW